MYNLIVVSFFSEKNKNYEKLRIITNYEITNYEITKKSTFLIATKAFIPGNPSQFTYSFSVHVYYMFPEEFFS